jgi:hypothetical protein
MDPREDSSPMTFGDENPPQQDNPVTPARRAVTLR